MWQPRPPGAIGDHEVRMCHAVAARKTAGQRRTIASLADDLSIDYVRAEQVIRRLIAHGLLFQPTRGVGQLRPMFTCHRPLTAEQQRANRLALRRLERTS